MRKTIKDYQKEIRNLKKTNEIKNNTIKCYYNENCELLRERNNANKTIEEQHAVIFRHECEINENHRNLIYKDGIIRGLMTAIMCYKGVVPNFNDVEYYQSLKMFEQENRVGKLK